MTGILSGELPAGWVRCPELGCGARAGHEPPHVPEAVPPVAVAPAGRWVRRCTARSDCGRPAGHAPPCVPTRSDCTCGPYDPESRCTWCDGLVWQAAAVAVAGPEVDVGAEVRGDAPTLAADLRIPDVIDVEALADTWAVQWRALVEADPATLTAGAVRRRDAMVSIAAYVRATRIASPTRAERIEAAARRLVRAQGTTYAIEATCGLGEQRSDALRAEERAFDALRAALCTCTGHGPDPACVEHGAAIRAWQKENGT